MTTQKIWTVKYVPGNPALFSRVVTAAGGPYRRSEALNTAEAVANNGGGWRVWVERSVTGQRIFESAAECEHVKTFAVQSSIASASAGGDTSCQ